MSWACPASMQGLLQGLKYRHTYSTSPSLPWDKFELLGQHFLVAPKALGEFRCGVLFAAFTSTSEALWSLPEYIPVRHVIRVT
jgi:hypothetical protein